MSSTSQQRRIWLGVLLLSIGHLFIFTGSSINGRQRLTDLVTTVSTALPSYLNVTEQRRQPLRSQSPGNEILSDIKGKLPNWMTEYFDWHNRTRSQLTESNWNLTDYIIMSCIKSRPNCGGFSDRLKPLPYILWHAARQKRLLFINWERPARLEEFLVPPQGGDVDWRLPSGLEATIVENARGAIYSCINRDLLDGGKGKKVLQIAIQSGDGCEEWFLNVSQTSYVDIYHGLFRQFFKPVDRIQKKIDNLMTQKGLVPGEYSAAHLRKTFGKQEPRDNNTTIAITVNGINCASRQVPGSPVYFASDDKFAIQVGSAYARQYSLPVVSLDSGLEPLHLDNQDAWETRDPSEFDDTFIDMYMLGQARCVAYSNGGYGPFGSLLSYNASCGIRFLKARNLDAKCNWTDGHFNESSLPPPRMNLLPE